ncbi:MAG TPA: glutathione S-transferase family protein [Povalibacter sp.]|uniref:glutathione S-transferase family protein n=1 Tax=Povalibacter sp. TaxID=1962978 RepID=UPI002D07C8D6|nr:glutathione S-transferase family protein [Povalibacter sp.]HMN47056.1 glutathione S-transferase family protein [Povalibacter sp.]
MLRLHGVAISNFYCIAKQALLEKGIAFEEVRVMANQEPAWLAISPMGKIPALETERGFLTETNVILEYLEDLHPATPLYPQDAFARAKVKQLIKVTELYLEAPAHQLVPWLFGSNPLPDYLRETVRPQLERGLAALRRLATFSPWASGEQYTAADIFLYRSTDMVQVMTRKFYDWDAISTVPGLREWRAHMAQRPVTQAIDQESNAARQEILKKTGRA